LGTLKLWIGSMFSAMLDEAGGNKAIGISEEI